MLGLAEKSAVGMESGKTRRRTVPAAVEGLPSGLIRAVARQPEREAHRDELLIDERRHRGIGQSDGSRVVWPRRPDLHCVMIDEPLADGFGEQDALLLAGNSERLVEVLVPGYVG